MKAAGNNEINKLMKKQKKAKPYQSKKKLDSIYRFK